MTSERGRVVEFFGFSGTGKSTLYSRVLQELRASGVVANRLSFGVHEVSVTRAATVLRQLFSRPWYAFQSAKQIASSRQRSLHDFQWVLRTWLERSFQVESYTRMVGVHLMEEGIFQVLWSMVLSATKTNVTTEISSLCTIAPMPSGIVTVEASPNSIEERLAKRKRNGRIERWLQEDPDFFEYALQRFREVEDLLMETSSQVGIPVLRIRNENRDDLDVNLTKILEFLANK